MVFTKEELNKLKKSFSYEWLISNGIGSFASSTIIGLNTRKYHGIMVASLTPPSKRHLILSKVDESITIADKIYNLYTNQTEDSLSEGYKYQQEFEFNTMPQFKYKIFDTSILKTICFEYGKNTIYVTYKIKNGKQKSLLTLAPLLNFRDFHATTKISELSYFKEYNNGILSVNINNNVPIKIWVSNSKFVQHNNDYFKNMYYEEEAKRGFYDTDNHIVPGVFEIEINPYEIKEVTFVCSLEKEFSKISGFEKIKKEKIRKNNLEKLARLQR